MTASWIRDILDNAVRAARHLKQAPVRWRKEPPTVADVRVNPWWWHKPADGAAPTVIKLSVEGCRYDADGDIVDLGYLDPNAEGVTAVHHRR